MADLIKKVKVMQQDGTFTDYIPLGADAANVKTEDGMSVENKLKKKPYYFDTLADMKADTKLKAGDTVITLGYYEVNDGGNGIYKIRTKTNNDVPDEMFTIALIDNTIVGELIFNNRVNANQLGCKIDGTDNSEQFNKIVNAALLYNVSVIFKGGTYKFTKNIEMASTLHFIGEGKVIFDFTDFDDETDFCIKITQKTTPEQYGDSYINNHLFENITFKGYEWGQIGTPSTNYLNKNLFFIETHTFTLSNLTIYGFNKAFTYGNNSYIIDVLNSLICFNNYGIYYDRASYTNTGERITFSNCTICNNNVGFYIDRVMMSFINCSIDYNGKICDKLKTMSNGVTDGHVNFIGCHFEDIIHDSSINRFIIDNGQVEFTGCGFWFGSLPFLKSTNDKDSILIENCLMRSENVPDNQLHDNYFIDSNYNNVLINGLFTRTPQNNIKISKNYNLIKNYNVLVANIQDGSIALNDGVLTLTNDPYKSAYTITNMINIPYGKAYLNCKFDIKSNNEVTDYSKFIEFYDDNDTNISNVSQSWNVNTEYQSKHFTIPIPLEATKCKLIFKSPGGSNKVADIKNIYASFN